MWHRCFLHSQSYPITTLENEYDFFYGEMRTCQEEMSVARHQAKKEKLGKQVAVIPSGSQEKRLYAYARDEYKSYRQEMFTPMSDDKRVAFLEFIRAVLKIPPGDRPTARQVHDLRWMRQYALPTAEETWGRAIM